MALSQPAFQLLERGGQYEDAHRLRQQLFHLLMSLYIDIQQNIRPGALGGADLVPGGAVIIIEDPRPFKQVSSADHAAKLPRGHKKIVATVFFTCSWFASGVRDGKSQAGN